MTQGLNSFAKPATLSGSQKYICKLRSVMKTFICLMNKCFYFKPRFYDLVLMSLYFIITENISETYSRDSLTCGRTLWTSYYEVSSSQFSRSFLTHWQLWILIIFVSSFSTRIRIFSKNLESRQTMFRNILSVKYVF